MGIDPAAVLALISTLTVQIADLQTENARLRADRSEKTPNQA
jgi:uncharacterized small protein (DUF1192 family)